MLETAATEFAARVATPDDYGEIERAIGLLRRHLGDRAMVMRADAMFHRAVVRSEAFRRGELATGWVDANWDGEAARGVAVRKGLLAAGLAAMDEATTAGPPTAGGAGSRRHGRDGDTAAGIGWRRGGRAQGVDRWPS